MPTSAPASKPSNAAAQEPTAAELLQRICKLRWMGAEQEASRMQAETQHRLPGGGVLTAQHETD